MTQFLKPLLLICLFLTGCFVEKEGPDTIEGIWSGTITYPNSVKTVDITGLTTSSGELRFITSFKSTTTGLVSVSDERFTGTYTMYASQGETLYNGATKNTGTLGGTFIPGDRISGESTENGVTTSTFKLTYSAYEYEKPSSLAHIAGTYSVTNDEITTTLVILSDSSVSGTNTNGCNYFGNVFVKNTEYNMYDLTLNVEMCDELNGTYTGLSTLSAFTPNPRDETLNISINSNDNAITLIIPRA